MKKKFTKWTETGRSENEIETEFTKKADKQAAFYDVMPSVDKLKERESCLVETNGKLYRVYRHNNKLYAHELEEVT